jgi:N-acetylmuramic acid 6-phosphate etherase
MEKNQQNLAILEGMNRKIPSGQRFQCGIKLVCNMFEPEFLQTSGVLMTELAETERADARYKGFDTWSDTDALAALWLGQQNAIASVQAALPDISAAVSGIVEKLHQGEGRLIYAGAGSSGLLAMQDGMEMTPTFSWPPERLVFLMAGGDAARLDPVGVVEDDAGAATRDAASVAITSADVVIGVAASGTTPYTLALLGAAKTSGALTIAIVNNANTPLAALADQAIVLRSGPEVIAGSTRLAAGTAQKAALGLMSSLLMTRLGHVIDGYMVSLTADNIKLRNRASRMIADIANVNEDTASAALENCDGQVKPAILVASGMTRTEAQDALAATSGDLRRTLKNCHERQP